MKILVGLWRISPSLDSSSASLKSASAGTADPTSPSVSRSWRHGYDSWRYYDGTAKQWQGGDIDLSCSCSQGIWVEILNILRTFGAIKDIPWDFNLAFLQQLVLVINGDTANKTCFLPNMVVCGCQKWNQKKSYVILLILPKLGGLDTFFMLKSKECIAHIFAFIFNDIFTNRWDWQPACFFLCSGRRWMLYRQHF